MQKRELWVKFSERVSENEWGPLGSYTERVFTVRFDETMDEDDLADLLFGLLKDALTRLPADAGVHLA